MMNNDFYKYLCCGYDKIRNPYANPQKMTFTPILDEEVLKKKRSDWYSAPEGTSHSECRTIIGSSRYEMEEAFDNSCKVEYNALNVSASLSTAVDITNSVSENSAYGKIYSSHDLRQYNLTLTPEALPDCLSESFLQDLKSCDAEKIFKRYGTHLILGFHTGGRIVMEFSMMDKGSKTETEIKAEAEAKYKSLSGNVSANYKRMAESFTSRSEISLWTIGGSPTALTDWDDQKDIMKTWVDSLEKAPAMYEVLTEIPIWELVRDQQLSQKLRKGFRTHYRAALLEAIRKIPYITDLRVIMSNKSNIRDLLKKGDYVVQKNPTTAPGNCDLNEKAGGKYIYLIYRLDTDPGKKISDVRVLSNSKNIKKASSSDYTVIGEDLNKGAGGHYIYLEYKRNTAPEEPGIYALGVRESNVPFSADWKPVVDQDGNTADLNRKAGGKYLYMYYFVHPYVKKLKKLYDQIQ